MAPSTSDVLETPRSQRTPEEIATYLKTRYWPPQHQGKKTKVLRRVTTNLTSNPTEDFAPRYADWEACASLYVAIDILTQNDGICNSRLEEQTLKTDNGLLVLVACAL